MIKHTTRHGTPLPPEVQEHLREVIREIGEYETAKQIGVAYSSIARAAAGMGLRKGTAVAIELRLTAMKSAKEAASSTSTKEKKVKSKKS